MLSWELSRWVHAKPRPGHDGAWTNQAAPCGHNAPVKGADSGQKGAEKHGQPDLPSRDGCGAVQASAGRFTRDRRVEKLNRTGQRNPGGLRHLADAIRRRSCGQALRRFARTSHAAAADHCVRPRWRSAAIHGANRPVPGRSRAQHHRPSLHQQEGQEDKRAECVHDVTIVYVRNARLLPLHFCRVLTGCCRGSPVGGSVAKFPG